MDRRRCLYVLALLAAGLLPAGQPDPADAAAAQGTIIVRVRNEPRPGNYVKLPNVPVYLNGVYRGVTDANGVLTISNVNYGTYPVSIRYQNRTRTQTARLSQAVLRIDFVNP